ncbi:alanine racemase [Fusobacterium sp. PH5-44]|uniref:alanine racemase n=1 Tax=unclassified Fusobacterium TaxID=2648384 RepID=UPI003D261D89
MRVWVEIDVDNLLHNISQIKRLSPNKEVISVIKANCYGLGAVEMSKILEKNGISFFGVATLEEAQELRKNSIKSKILILGSLFEDELLECKGEDFHITISTMEHLRFLVEHDINVSVQLKIDTGMGRLGFLPNEIDGAYRYCKENNIYVSGMYSHLSDADIETEESNDYTIRQIEEFIKFEDYNVDYFHILNSGGISRYFDKISGNAVRPGICMYGMLGEKKIDGFKSVVTMKSKVLYKRTAVEERAISYGRTATLKKGETFATVAVGYADGLHRDFSNKMYFIIKGEKCPVIGNICMDMCIVKLPATIASNVAIEDEVIVYNDEIIRDITTPTKCSWEILTGIGRRVYRVYLKDKKAYKTLRWISE